MVLGSYGMDKNGRHFSSVQFLFGNQFTKSDTNTGELKVVKVEAGLMKNVNDIIRDVNRKPEIRFSVLKPKSGFRFWKPNLEFIFLNYVYLWKIA